jgi:hypothetical protein
MTVFYRLRFETPTTWRAMSLYLYTPQTESGPVISPGTGFPLRRLLRLAGLRRRYSNPPPHGNLLVASNCAAYNIPTRTTSKTLFISCCVEVRCRGNVLTEPLFKNGLHNPIVLLLRALPRNGRCLESLFSNRSIRHNIMVNKRWIGRDLAAGGCDLIEVLYWNVPRRTQEIHEDLQ